MGVGGDQSRAERRGNIRLSFARLPEKQVSQRGGNVTAVALFTNKNGIHSIKCILCSPKSLITNFPQRALQSVIKLSIKCNFTVVLGWKVCVKPKRLITLGIFAVTQMACFFLWRCNVTHRAAETHSSLVHLERTHCPAERNHIRDTRGEILPHLVPTFLPASLSLSRLLPSLFFTTSLTSFFIPHSSHFISY